MGCPYANPPEAEVTGSNPVGRTNEGFRGRRFPWGPLYWGLLRTRCFGSSRGGKVYYREADLNADRRDDRGGPKGPRRSILSGVLE